VKPSSGFGLRSIRTRFVLVLLASAGLFAAVAATVTYTVEYQRTEAAARQTLEDLMTAVEKTAAVGTFTGDRLLMQEVIEGLARNRLVASVRIVDDRGQVLASGPTAVSAGAAPPLQRALISPFIVGQEIGALQVTENHPFIAAEARQRAQTMAALLAGLIALIAWVLHLTVARFVSRPIVQLARALRDMPPGTRERIAVPAQHARDEFGMLIAGANSLLETNAGALARERALRADVERMEAQYREIFDATSAGIFLLDEQGRLIDGNPTVLRLLGRPDTDMASLRGADFLAAAFAEPARARDLVERAAHSRQTEATDLCVTTPEGSASWVHCLLSVRRREQGGRLVEGVMYDITDRKRTEGQVRHEAEHDVLTGLKNRRAAQEAINRIVAEAAAGGAGATLLFLDLDGFKTVNDQHGHPAGDAVLVQCAERMRQVVRRNSDLVGRLGGDEFVVMLPHTGAGDLQGAAVAAALIESIAEPFELPDGGRACIGASIGMAAYPVHGDSRGALEASADEALYAVKRTGKRSFAMALALSNRSARR
jgi:diguanylate cyclase (GGDEF)-like protein/PAS domain S-box-containing protein